MQNGSVILDGSGTATVLSPCLCEAVDLIDSGHVFSFQFADPITAEPIGAVCPASEWSSTLFLFRAESQRAIPWQVGQVIGFITAGTASDVISVVPRRPA